MSDTWFTSDTHLFHEKVAVEARGFESTERHNEFLAHRWDKCVQPEDDVWVLGDITLRSDLSQVVTWFQERKGRKHLVLGNHDRAHPCNRNGHNYQQPYFEAFHSVQTAARVSIGEGRTVNLSHFSYDTDRGGLRYGSWRLADYGVPIIHGHTHGTERLTLSERGTPQIHVGLDAWDFRPVRMHVVREMIEEATS